MSRPWQRASLLLLWFLGMPLSAATDNGNAAGPAWHDVEIQKILDASHFYSLTTEAELQTYMDQLENRLAQYPGTTLKAAVYRRMGDICFTLKRYRAMRGWYRQALALDPALRQKTPMGYRLYMAGKIIRKQNILMACYGVYGFLAALLVVKLARLRRFDMKVFLLRTSLFGLLLLAGIGIILFIDSLLLGNAINSEAFSDEPHPVAVYSFIRVVPAGALIGTSLACFLPIIFTAAHLAMAKKTRRLRLAVQTVALTAALWTQWFLQYSTDENFDPVALWSSTRLFLPGEIEIELLENPRGIFEANPDFFTSDNMDLQSFLELHFPDGVDAILSGKE